MQNSRNSTPFSLSLLQRHFMEWQILITFTKTPTPPNKANIILNHKTLFETYSCPQNSC